MNLGENIYRLRTERNLSQGDLADALEVSRQSVSKWENNAAVPELDKLIRLSQIFGITLDELTEQVPPTPAVTPVPPVTRSQLELRQIIGLLLLGLGALTFLIYIILETVR